MKAHLMYPDKDFNLNDSLELTRKNLCSDLELEMVFESAACGDNVIYGVFSSGLFSGMTEPETIDIEYRHAILRDCIENADIVRLLYKISREAIEKKRKIWWEPYRNSPSSLMLNSVYLLKILVQKLIELREVADKYSALFKSAGFRNFFMMLQKELDDNYLLLLQTALKELSFENGMLVSVSLGDFNQAVDYILLQQLSKKNIWHNFFSKLELKIAERDDAGHADLSRRRNLALRSIVKTVSNSSMNVLVFFTALQNETAFYTGCLNLYDALQKNGRKICFPSACKEGRNKWIFENLCDMSMSLTDKAELTGNTIKITGKNKIIITGANQGGKTTFLRSIGLAQIMLQCGMFVTADKFVSCIYKGIYSHFKKEEDTSMESGKLDEEMRRMSAIADKIKPGSIILFNESFSSTNEKEGSEICRQITSALTESGVTVFFVTHFYDFSHSLFTAKEPLTLFLRAERMSNGERTYRISEGEPQQTSFGLDIFRKIFD